MMYYYESFNLKILSQNLELPELNKISESKNYDVLIKEEKINFDIDNKENVYNTNFIKFYPNNVTLKVNDICLFKIEGGNKIYWHKLNNSIKEDDIRTFLLGSAIGSLLIQRGFVVLHGNALEKNGKAIVCLGHSGTGKSTIAYSLMKQGWNLLSDDLVAINENGIVVPGIPRIKLWKDVAVNFKLNINELKPIRNNLKKYSIQGKQIINNRETYPLHALYLLERDFNVDSSSNTETIKIKSEKVNLLRLKNQLYRTRFVKGLGKESELFLKLVKLQKKVPVVRLPVKNSVSTMYKWLIKNDLSQTNFWIP